MQLPGHMLCFDMKMKSDSYCAGLRGPLRPPRIDVGKCFMNRSACTMHVRFRISRTTGITLWVVADGVVPSHPVCACRVTWGEGLGSTHCGLSLYSPACIEGCCACCTPQPNCCAFCSVPGQLIVRRPSSVSFLCFDPQQLQLLQYCLPIPFSTAPYS